MSQLARAQKLEEMQSALVWMLKSTENIISYLFDHENNIKETHPQMQNISEKLQNFQDSYGLLSYLGSINLVHDKNYCAVG